MSFNEWAKEMKLSPKEYRKCFLFFLQNYFERVLDEMFPGWDTKGLDEV